MANHNSSQMRIELDQMDLCAQSLQRVNRSLDAIWQQLRIILPEEKQAAWCGEAKNVYMEGINDTLSLLGKANLFFIKEHRKLTEAISVYRKKEGLIGEQLQKLSTDSPFL